MPARKQSTAQGEEPVVRSAQTGLGTVCKCWLTSRSTQTCHSALLRSPWLPQSTGASETLLHAQASSGHRELERGSPAGSGSNHHWHTESSRGTSAGEAEPRAPCPASLCLTWHPDSDPKYKYALQIIPELFTPGCFYGTLRDFYFWLSIQQEMYPFRSFSTALTLAGASSKYTLLINISALSMSTPQLVLEQYFSDY